MQEIKQEDLILYSNVSLETMLWDVRNGSWGIKFGKVKDICSQYGITCEQLPNCMKFSAPKLRLEKFMEKLHFSKNRYWK